LVTGEQDFDEFYDRFASPYPANGDRPVAWTTRFIPDMMDDVFWSQDPLETKVKEFKKLYDQCKAIEKAFNREKKKA
jgi:hypothetical protein